jgi:5'-3' exonuclease|tara:strand:+ start:77 stop:1042 length:966 start_codon:yes stop_codon:yes gene_type:complete
LNQKKKRVLIIDGMNNFIRCYVVDPTMDVNGNPIGGVTGFLKTLQKNIRETSPDMVIVCWEGINGNLRRRQIDENYKLGRNPPRLNREYETTPEEQQENKLQQQIRLIEYLEQLPVVQLSADETEADDVIAWAVQTKYFDGWQKLILSNDKDFYQLCDDDTIIIRPTSKEIINKKRLIEEFGIHPRNFGLARSIVGDKSDNLIGVSRVGLATVAKRFPFLKEDKDYSIADVLSYARENETSIKAYASVAESKDLIDRNYQIMQLYAPVISPESRSQLSWAVENTSMLVNKTKIRVMLMQDGIASLNLDQMLAYFKNQQRLA